MNLKRLVRIYLVLRALELREQMHLLWYIIRDHPSLPFPARNDTPATENGGGTLRNPRLRPPEELSVLSFVKKSLSGKKRAWAATRPGF